MATPTKSTSDTDNDLAEPLKNEIAALRSDLGELGSIVARIGKNRAGGLRNAAETTAHEGYVKGEAAFQDVLKELRKIEGEVVDTAREKPRATIGIAALVGFILGAFFRR